jgi:sarcosine oxidase
LLDAGHRVALIDAFGAAHSRASSGGESRVIRMGYGSDELYTRWAVKSLAAWNAFSARCQQPIFHQAGMLWLTGDDDRYLSDTQQTLQRVGVDHRRLSVDELRERFPQISSEEISWAMMEPESGVLMARRSIQLLVEEDIQRGLDFRVAQVPPPLLTTGHALRLSNGDSISAGAYVFACGPWLPKLFPDELGSRIFPTRQEIFFFAPPPGDRTFAPPAMSAWLHQPDLVYGIPDLENRGFKISIDRHGPAFDPDTGLRIASDDGLASVRAYLAKRFPKLAGATLTESRVCQYENTSNGDFIIDRHPEMRDVLIVGGGSGHGFKHGPAVGDYARDVLTTSTQPEPRFALASKDTRHVRTVY